jgi:hypothetical protein
MSQDLYVPLTPERLGQIAYEAYGAERDGKAFDGSPLLEWFELAPELRRAWIVSASNLVAAFNHNMMNCAHCRMWHAVHSGLSPWELPNKL